MKKLIIVIAAMFLTTTAWFWVSPSTEYLTHYDAWKGCEGYSILGDAPSFRYNYPNLKNDSAYIYSLKVDNDTIYCGIMPKAIIVSIGLRKLTIRTIDGKQFGVYNNKRFD